MNSIVPAMKRATMFCLMFLSFAALSLGCSRNKGVHPVNGEVFVDGQPAKGAMVYLHPRDNSTARPAYAMVQDDGTFRLSTFGKNDGAAAGDYIVTISWFEEEFEEGESISYLDKLGDRYRNPANSELVATVSAPSTTLPRYDLKRPAEAE